MYDSRAANKIKLENLNKARKDILALLRFTE